MKGQGVRARRRLVGSVLCVCVCVSVLCGCVCVCGCACGCVSHVCCFVLCVYVPCADDSVLVAMR